MLDYFTKFPTYFNFNSGIVAFKASPARSLLLSESAVCLSPLSNATG